MLPDKLAAKVNNSQNVKIQPKQNGEVRILSADIALMSSRKNNNDATAIFLNQLLPTKAGRFTSNIIYADACEGLRTDDQALLIRKLFDEYNCDYLVLDTSGLGLGVYDFLSRLGADITYAGAGLSLTGRKTLEGGEVSSHNDHRIAMAAAVASCGCAQPVIIHGAEAVRKSYPGFFRDFASLGGNVKEI